MHLHSPRNPIHAIVRFSLETVSRTYADLSAVQNDSMKRPNKAARRHHFIPQFVLRSFTDDGDHLWFTWADGRWKEPRRTGVKNIFLERDLYTTTERNGSTSDENEKALARKESDWSRAIENIRNHLDNGESGMVQEADARLAVEYYLYAGFRSPERVKAVMHDAEHSPKDVILKMNPGTKLDEEEFPILEKNIRAILGSGQADSVKEQIEKLVGARGLGLHHLDSDDERFILGSCGTAKPDSGRFFVPVHPRFALFCTDYLGGIPISQEKGDELVQEINNSLWTNSKQVAADSKELLEAVETRKLNGH